MPIPGSWSHFLKAGRTVYPLELAMSHDAQKDNKALKQVADVIGGDVSKYIHQYLDGGKDSGGWSNACAVRMSYILNQNAYFIPAPEKLPKKYHVQRQKVRGQPKDVKITPTFLGGDGRYYFNKVHYLLMWMEEGGLHRLPDFRFTNPADLKDGSKLEGKRGILIFKISGWEDASGHATLYDGVGRFCYDHCYFQDYLTDHYNPPPHATQMLFWEIKGA